jgi:hypothetical protein
VALSSSGLLLPLNEDFIVGGHIIIIIIEPLRVIGLFKKANVLTISSGIATTFPHSILIQTASFIPFFFLLGPNSRENKYK